MTGLETAKAWQVRPLEFFGVEGRGAWTETDRSLSVALELYERGKCPDCGIPRQIAYDPAMDGWFEVPDEATVCYACAARDRVVMDEHLRAEPGQKFPVVNTLPAEVR
ncbi:hypothetical protein [Trueperella abortisuis]|uniref:Uncharacterized protein n=1 Tax=Trueperella abortisuis TaxID=445930 RepID=A0ABT9PKS3_9ACTO|nr:hypothetical protein [Trueperella abortisuis]MDP9832994.1 hypothetical protein [Trueperella abortisuis]